MNIYLIVMVTVLVLTQIGRLIQNSMQLRNHKETTVQNNRVMEIYEHLEKALKRMEEEK